MQSAWCTSPGCQTARQVMTEEQTKVDSTPSANAVQSAPPKKDKPAKRTKTTTGAPRKRGPPRPHRKLTQEVLDGRIGKLRKRIDKARGQLEDAERHIEAYVKEAGYREDEKKME